jgi:hypothetical protein
VDVDGFYLQGGKLMGSGTINTPLLDNSGGNIDQSGLTGSQTLTILGDYTQRGTGTLTLKNWRDAGGLHWDALDVTAGDVTLGGDLVTSYAAGFAGMAGDEALILPYGTLAGDFAQKALPPGFSVQTGGAGYTLVSP